MSAEERDELARLAHGLASELRRRMDLGQRRAERPARPAPAPSSTAPASAPDRELRPSPPPRREPAAGPAESPAAAANREKAADCPDLGSLAELVAGCRACELCESRTQTVFMDGDARARVLFIGEAPGQNEDRQGVPFVGRAGQLLTDIIEKGMGLKRSQVAIANVLKCRPPGNRDPLPGEKELCTPFLDRQIELIDPEILVTLGLHASQHVLGSTSSMRNLRGTVHLRSGRKVVATYHPAFLLRSPGMKKDCWQDIQLAMAELGLEKPSRGEA